MAVQGRASILLSLSFIIVDIEADGPIPVEYSMVCFGAVMFDNPLDDARGNAEALKKFKELGLKI